METHRNALESLSSSGDGAGGRREGGGGAHAWRDEVDRGAVVPVAENAQDALGMCVGGSDTFGFRPVERPLGRPVGMDTHPRGSGRAGAGRVDVELAAKMGS